MTTTNTGTCPICHNPFTASPRYPKAICASCVQKATDENGRGVEYFNTSFSGGCQVFYSATRQTEIYNSDRCYVSGFTCRAQEGYFGGIVLQVTGQL